MCGAYARQRFSFTITGKACKGKPRSEPDWGKPAVRDRREACGNVRAKEDGLCGPLEKSVANPRILRCEARRTSIPTTFFKPPGVVAPPCIGQLCRVVAPS